MRTTINICLSCPTHKSPLFCLFVQGEIEIQRAFKGNEYFKNLNLKYNCAVINCFNNHYISEVIIQI